jgi:hypothetical protein
VVLVNGELSAILKLDVEQCLHLFVVMEGGNRFCGGEMGVSLLLTLASRFET